MSEKAASKSTRPQVQISGKLKSVERYDGQNGPIFENLIVMAAPDEFTIPLRLVVKSSNQIGEVDTIVDVKAEIQSKYWRNPKNGKKNYVPEFWLAA